MWSFLHSIFNQLISYAYTAYGDLLPESPTPSVFGYNAEATDNQTGLQYLRARYYSPETGRFIQKDEYKGDFAKPETLNRYAYCSGNPIEFSDPSGNQIVEGGGGGANPTSSSPTTETPGGESNPTATICENDEDEWEVMILGRYWKPLDSEWSYSIDRANEGTRTYTHIHYKKGDDENWESENDNEDHPQHEEGKGKKVPEKVKKKAKEKGIWPPKGAEKETKKVDSQALNKAIGIGLITVAVIGVAVLAVDDLSGIGVADDPLLVPAIGMVTKGIQMVAG